MSTNLTGAGASRGRFSAATTPSGMRRRNRGVVLSAAWGASDPFTATDLIEATGLTRATVLDVCRDLVDRRWFDEVAGEASLTPGRQALRFTFNRSRSLVLGADIGHHTVAVAVADLTGAVLGKASRPFREADGESRSAYFEEIAEEALAQAGAVAADIAVACLGIAAPVLNDGAPPEGSSFWGSVTVDRDLLAERYGSWRVFVENDANLAALAQIGSPDVDGTETFVTLLSGERLGAGLILGGELQRGAHGIAGEMDYLERVIGVEGSHGIAALARMFEVEARAGHSGTVAGDVTVSPQPEDILRAAAAGDPAATAITERIADRLALAISTVGGLLDPEVVVIAGGIAAASGDIVELIQDRLYDLVPSPPRVVASSLGRDVVLGGAVRKASDEVLRLALDDED